MVSDAPVPSVALKAGSSTIAFDSDSGYAPGIDTIAVPKAV
ncbi:hypothetical protein ACWGCW_30490 [Streptomyces sp. NPDC054933]